MEQSNKQSNEPIRNTKSIWIAIISIIILIVGGGIYARQQSNSKATEQNLQKQISALQSQINQFQQKEIEQKILIANEESQQESNQIIESLSLDDEVIKDEKKDMSNNPLCTNLPTGTASGRDIYPINEKYEQIEFLGQIFTAYNCGTVRLNKVFGVKKGVYTLGSTVWLRDYPGKDFSLVLQNAGYECDEVAMGEYHCMLWKLDKDISVDELMSLEPFADIIKTDDCISCG